jgi:hypothetical protein
MTLGVDYWTSGQCCCLACNELQWWKLYLATWGLYVTNLCTPAMPNLLPIGCCLAFLSSPSPKFHRHIPSKISPPTVTESIRHYWNFPNAARSEMSLRNLQTPPARAGVHLATVSNVCIPGYRTNATSPDTQPLILSSTCWTY